jgi:hypothetical protein
MLMRELVLLVVGFVLTTVVGGILGSWLQQRAWDHQQEAQLREQELRRADGVCRQISQLLDKRLYRMLRLFYALQAAADRADTAETITRRLEEYDAILYEWNDELNLNLALIGSYFGETARDWLDHEIYENYKRVGAELEELYRTVTSGINTEFRPADLKAHLDSLNDQVYRLGVFMMTQLRAGQVGRTAPHPLQRSESPAAVTARGQTATGASR